MQVEIYLIHIQILITGEVQKHLICVELKADDVDRTRLENNLKTKISHLVNGKEYRFLSYVCQSIEI